jgi:hypothetical protein
MAPMGFVTEVPPPAARSERMSRTGIAHAGLRLIWTNTHLVAQPTAVLVVTVIAVSPIPKVIEVDSRILKHERRLV